MKSIRLHELSLLMLAIYLAASGAAGWFAHHYAQNGVVIQPIVSK